MARPRKSPPSAPGAREAETTGNYCQNPFCGAGLANRVAKYCEDKPDCQRYRAVVMFCAFRRVMASAGAAQTTGERGKSSARSSEAEAGDAGFSIPRRKRKAEGGSQREQQDQGASAAGQRKKKATAKKKKKRKSQLTEESAVAAPAIADQDQIPTEMRVRQRFIQQHIEGSASTEAQQMEAEQAAAAMEATDRTAGGRATTTAQAVKHMDIELVPLGASNQAVNYAGGGRYVQSGNRTAGPTLPSHPPPLPPVPPPPLPPRPPLEATGTASAASRPVSSQASTNTPYASQPASLSTLSSSIRTNSASSGTTLPKSEVPNFAVETGSSRPDTLRISASDYLSYRKTQEPTPALPTSTRTDSSNLRPSVNPPITDPRQSSRDHHESDDPDYSFSDWDQSTGHEPVTSSSHSSLSSGRSDFQRTLQERPRLTRTHSHPDGRNLPSPVNRPEYRKNLSENTFQPSPSYRDERYARSSIPDAYRELRSYPEERRREQPSYRSVDERARVEEYSRRNRDDGRRSPREDGLKRNRSLSRESFGGPRDTEDSFGRDIRRDDQDRLSERASARAPAPSPTSSDTRDRRDRVSASSSNGRGAPLSPGSSSLGSHYSIDPPQFSYHDQFVSDLLSTFICDIPDAIKAVKNKTKKARKMSWYLDYVDRVRRLLGPDVNIEIKNNKAVMLVKQREWLVMDDLSTVTLYTRVLHRLLGEACMWRYMKEQTERRYQDAVRVFGKNTDLGITFIQVWNGLKTHTSQEYISLEKQVRYICGARKHHWSFSVGNVEIGSGSHEDKRTAFNFATAASMRFLLKLRKPAAEHRPQEHNSTVRARERTSTEVDYRTNRDRRHNDRSMAGDHIRSERVADRSNDRGIGASAVIGGGTNTARGFEQCAANEAPSYPQPTNSRVGNDLTTTAAAAATVVAADPRGVAGQPVDPRLRRPATDLRVRYLPPADPRANDPASTPRIQGPASEYRAGAESSARTAGPTTDSQTRTVPSDPRPASAPVTADQTSNVASAKEPNDAGTSTQTVELSDDEMSISDESDHESSQEAPAKLPPKPKADTQDTACHFCAMIRMNKPGAADATCFRCRAKMTPATS